MSGHWRVEADAAAVADAACAWIIAAGDRAVKQRGEFRLVLAGGSTPEATYRRLAQSMVDLSQWSFFFGDERCLPPGHRDRNSVMAHRAWLGPARVAMDSIHVIPAEAGPRAGADAYRPVVARAQPFDLVLLGVGVDGHTASLFPGSFPPPEALVVAVSGAPKPPRERVSLADAPIRAARQRLVLVTGADKHPAVTQWRGRGQLPIARVTEGVDTWVIADRAAAGE